MEHSYIGNNFVNEVEHLLKPGGAWHKDHIVWGGDYADGEPGTETAETKDGENLYSLIGVDENEIKPHAGELPKEFKYLVNHDKKVFIDRTKIKDIPDWEGTKINPLPLLTCEGNLRGGGDYHGTRMDVVGSWARNSISIESEIPEGYTEMDGQFKEGR